MPFEHVATFHNSLEAEMARGRLEAQGIKCLLRSDAAVASGVNGLSASRQNLLGGVELLVPGEHMTQAQAVLREMHKRRTYRRSSDVPQLVLQIAAGIGLTWWSEDFAGNFYPPARWVAMAVVGCVFLVVIYRSAKPRK